MWKKYGADVVLLTITIIWGASFTLMKNVLEHIPAFAYLSLRFFIGTAILCIVFFKSFRRMNRKVLLYGFILGLMMFGGMGLQVCGLYYTTASNSAFITGLYIVMVPLVSAVFLKKKPDKASLAGVFLGTVGLFFLCGALSFKFNWGDFLTLLCSVCWTFQIVFIDRFTNEQDPALLAILQIGFATVMYSGMWLATDPKPVVFDGTVIMTLLITGVLGTSLAFAGQTIVQRYTSPTHTALIFTGEPVFGALFAMLIPNSLGVTESLKLNSVIGCVLILLGMLVAELDVITGRVKAKG